MIQLSRSIYVYTDTNTLLQVSHHPMSSVILINMIAITESLLHNYAYSTQNRVHVSADSGDDYIVATWCNTNRVTETYQPQTIHPQLPQRSATFASISSPVSATSAWQTFVSLKWRTTEILLAFENPSFLIREIDRYGKNMKNTLQPAT